MDDGDVGADVDNGAHELVPDDEWRGDGVLRPGVPVINVEIGAADASTQHANEDIIDADRWYWHILQPQAWLGLALDQCLHCALLLMRRCVHRDLCYLSVACPWFLSALLLSLALSPANCRGSTTEGHVAICSHILVCVPLPVKSLPCRISTCAVELIALINRLPRVQGAIRQRMPFRVTGNHRRTDSHRHRCISLQVMGQKAR